MGKEVCIIAYTNTASKRKHLHIKEIFLKFSGYTDTWIGNSLLETAKLPATVSLWAI